MREVYTAALLSLFVCGPVLAEGRYDYQSSDAYRALAPAEQKKLNQVHRDFVLLWGALDMYAEEHDGQVPKRLSDLVPLYLKELPRDPFATKKTAQETKLASSDSRSHPTYLAERGNVSLYIAKGYWTGGGQFIR